MRTKIGSSLLRLMIEENALASHGRVSDCCFTRDVRSSIDFNRALQSGDCVQCDSAITHRLTILSSEVCVRTNCHCPEADAG